MPSSGACSSVSGRAVIQTKRMDFWSSSGSWVYCSFDWIEPLITSARSSNSAWSLSDWLPVLTGTRFSSEPGLAIRAAFFIAEKPISETPPGWIATRTRSPLSAAARMSSMLW